MATWLRRSSVWMRWLSAGLAVAIAAGCHSDAAAWHARVSAPEVTRLAGSWQLDLSAMAMKPDPEPHTSGQVALTVNDEHLSAGGLGSVPIYFGTYDVDFRPLGLSVGVLSGVPAVVATVSGDSMTLVLGPGSVTPATLRGVVRGDSIVGTWSMHHRAGVDAIGGFVLRRH